MNKYILSVSITNMFMEISSQNSIKQNTNSNRINTDLLKDRGRIKILILKVTALHWPMIARELD